MKNRISQEILGEDWRSHGVGKREKERAGV